MIPEQIKNKYQERILSVLNRLRQALIKAGHECEEPWDMSSDDYRWTFRVDNHIDVSLIICESERWDGEKGGVNFMVDVVEEGGRMLGGLTPYNYTDRVWVDREDEGAIEERFSIFEKADPADIVECVEKE